VCFYEIPRRKEKNIKTDSGVDNSKRGGGYSSFISLFCGACAVEAKVAPYFGRVICNDKQPYLIAFFKALQNGWKLPDSVSEEEYYYVKAHKDEDLALTALYGFPLSFGGAWFHGYAKPTKERNYLQSTKNALARDMPALQKAEFICKDYRDVEIPAHSVIYCDPPYAGTSGYGNEKFDSAAFWKYARKLVKDGHKVFISEEHAPEDFKCIYERTLRRNISVNKANLRLATEKLFIHKEE